MASTPPGFYRLWQEECVRDTLFEFLSKEDIGNVRLANSACCNIITKRLFTRVWVTFTSSTFTKPCRIQALSRIGHHIEHLTFYFPHSAGTFLPPLIHPSNGHEISFLYSPHTSMMSALTRSKYANTELGEILTQQYPPLFHAATNVPSFINAMKHIPNMRHLTIRCPGQDPAERYRRDIVDYALISLRISIERAQLPKFNKLSLSCLHPSAFNYLRHVSGFGSVPSAGRRWKQVRKLHISVQAWDFYGPSPGLDHLKVMDDYIRHFAPLLEKFTFSWVGRLKGPCPIALSADPLFAPPWANRKLFNEVTSPMSPLPPQPVRPPIHFPRLRHLQVRNATMNATQMSALVAAHQHTVRDFDFENVVLIQGGSWDDALAPLMDSSNRSDIWSRSSTGGSDVGSLRSTPSRPELPSTPSAAVEAASKDLLGSELGGLSLEELDQALRGDDEDDDGLASDVAAAREASRAFSTKLRKKRIHRRRRRKHHDDDDDERPRERSRSRHHHPREEQGRSHSRHRKNRPRKDSDGSSHSARSARSAGSAGSGPRPGTPMPPRLPGPPPPAISAPILDGCAPPVLLQPTVYDPAAEARAAAADPDAGISAVQRNIEREEAHRHLANDAAARVSALRKAKEAVLLKLSREFRRKTGGEVAGVGAGAGPVNCAMGARGLFGMKVPNYRSIDSQSALVPLMFSRS